MPLNGRDVEVLEVQPCNQRTIKCSQSLIHIENVLPHSIKRSMVHRMKEPDITTNPYESDSSDDGTSDDAELERLESFIYSAFSLKISNAHQIFPTPRWAMGRAPLTPDGSGTSVNIPTTVPAKDIELQVQVLIELDQSSGKLIVRSQYKKGPIYILENDQWVRLKYDETRILFQDCTLRISLKDYKLILPHHSQEEIAAFDLARNKVFIDAGLSIPNPGIWCLPGEVPASRVGRFILHDSVTWPGSDWGRYRCRY